MKRNVHAQQFLRLLRVTTPNNNNNNNNNNLEPQNKYITRNNGCASFSVGALLALRASASKVLVGVAKTGNVVHVESDHHASKCNQTTMPKLTS